MRSLLKNGDEQATLGETVQGKRFCRLNHP
jgi:hypothetical protein